MLGYAGNELRRRLGRTLLTAFGLAAGVGLVIGIIGVSQGLDDAQRNVLKPLQSVGTDILVTRVVGNTQASASATPTPQASAGGRFGGGFGGGGFFGPGRGGGPGGLNADDINALAQENNSVTTDLSKLGKPGQHFTHDFFLSATLISFPQEAVDQLKSLSGVAGVSGALTQLAEHQTGTVPQIVAEIQTGGQTLTQTARPAPPTQQEQAQIEKCIAAQRANSGSPEPSPSPGGGGGFERGGGFRFSCLPDRFRQFRFSFRTPLETLRQVIDPPQTDITSTSYSAAGIDPASQHLGLVTTEQLVKGRWLAVGATDEVMVSAAYANKQSLDVGASIPINGTTFHVVGIVSPTLSGASADVYFPLPVLQQLAGKTARVTQVLVKADSSANVDALAKRIQDTLPGAEVVTTKSLADQVTGSLADARKLASRLGTALGIIVLAAAFVIAVLLTLGSIAKRVREIGTLRAIGWSRRRVVRQVLSETLGIGLLGGVIGIGVGMAVALAVGAFSPTLTATTSGVPNATTSSLAQFFGSALQSTLKTTTVALKAPVHPATLALGVGFALVGGLIAGAVGGWRASRLSPAEALRSVG
jgi:ABC-type antimicrobial peptide transport system permease subunit